MHTGTFFVGGNSTLKGGTAVEEEEEERDSSRGFFGAGDDDGNVVFCGHAAALFSVLQCRLPPIPSTRQGTRICTHTHTCIYMYASVIHQGSLYVVSTFTHVSH
jgi:hypothetical protein